MSVQLFIQPQSLSKEQIETLSSDFDIVLSEKHQVEKVFDYLHDYFQKNEYKWDIISQYYDSYWQWYVRATWRIFNSLDFETIKALFPSQISTAIQLDIDVSSLFLSYFMERFNDDEMNEALSSLSDEFVQVDNPLRPNGKPEFSIKQIIDAYRKILRGDTLQSAAFFGQLEEELFHDDVVSPAITEEDQAAKVSEFINLVMFVADKKDVVRAVQAYYEGITDPIESMTIDRELYMEGVLRYLDEAQAQEESDNPLTYQLATALVDEQGNERTTEETLRILRGENASQTTEPKTSTNPYTAIKQQLISQFADESGNITNIEGLFDALDTMANEQGDEHIRELYMFDEAKGAFVWNESLLST